MNILPKMHTTMSYWTFNTKLLDHHHTVLSDNTLRRYPGEICVEQATPFAFDMNIIEASSLYYN